MSRDWEQTIKAWSKPASDTEEQKCTNAENMIRAAISADPTLSTMDIQVFSQGSYRNNTNVKQNSDVDICVRLGSTFFYDLPSGSDYTAKDFDIIPSSYSYADFKNSVGNALVNKFGRDGVTRGKKAFDIHANSYRVDADVVPCFTHRRYQFAQNGNYYYISGNEFWSDDGKRVINWPDQHYENGVKKNKATGNRFKYITRAIKRLKYEMVDNGVKIADKIPSFLIECFIWNVPNEGFGHDQYINDVRYALAHLCNNTRNDSDCKEWGEVSELKYLFGTWQPWTRQQANEFLNAAWYYIGFE